MDIEEWRRWLGSPDSHPLRRVPNARTQWECICRSRVGEGPQGRLAPETRRRSENHAPIPRLWWHVHGALPQHRARRQRDALEVGNRRFGNSVSATAADSHPETTRRHVYASGRHTSERFLRGRRKEIDQMNTHLKIKMRRLLFSPSFVTLSVGIVVVLAMLAGGGSSVQAQTTAAAPPSTAPAIVDSSLTISAKGTVNDPNGTITVSGSVIVNCRRVLDTSTNTTTPASPVVLLDLDFSKLSGTSGSTKTTLKTYVTGDNHASELRPLQASDTIIVTSPYFDSTKDVLSARTMLVTATLNFDTTTGKLTSGSISIGNNVVTAAAVGTITTVN